MKLRCNSSEEIVTNLSFAILPIDDFTGERPLDRTSISVKKFDIDGIINSSGHYLFFDLVIKGKYTLIIQSDSKKYLEMEYLVDLDLLYQDPDFRSNPVVTVRLIPSPSYPFSNGETLIRGIVQSTNDHDIFGTEKIPISGASVNVPKLNLSYKTDSHGEYVFYFTHLRTDDITDETLPGIGKRKYIKTTDGTSVFTLRVEHPDYDPFQSDNNRAEVGQVKSLDVNLKPK
jgi:hypothetical protein